MKARILMPLVGVVAGSLLSACGSTSRPAAPVNNNPPAQSLDTQQVLAQAQVTSETSEPYAVNDGALVLTDTSDTSEPININMM